MPSSFPQASVEAILVELARRGLLRAADATSRALPLEATRTIDDKLLERKRSRGQPGFVSSCGVRNLRVLNELYGSALGDLAVDVTCAIVERVLAESDPGATVARVHGSEVVVVHGTSSRDALRETARRIRDVAAAVSLPTGHASVPLRPLVASVELAVASSWSAGDLQRVLHEARARAGRTESGQALLEGTEAEAVLALVYTRDARIARVTEALARGDVEVHYQPVVHLKSGLLSDVEALARIRAGGTLLVAGEFIDAVHELGETAALDSIVMRRVGEQAHKLAQSTARLFVNVSPLSLGAASFREIMGSTIARLRGEGLQLVLVLELTEQALVENLEAVREIHRVHGVSFAVDDFGTGYSSLRTVSELAVNRVISYLKIDGSLTRRVAESAEAYKVVLAVAHLARSLDLRVIAEHVETPAILERLRTTGIECGQGFLFAPALPVDELAARHANGELRGAEAPPRPDLAVLEPYLHRAFGAFYDVMLSDPHFARHFRDERQVKALVEKQQQFFLESLADDEAGLRQRYRELGRRHGELGIPLATFLMGADLLHEQLLEVLLHTTPEPSVVLRTGQFFTTLRNHMARGYLERRLPELRLELDELRAFRGSGAGPDAAAGDALLGCLEAVLEAVEARLSDRPRAVAVRYEDCPATAALAASAEDAHRQIHADASSLAFFLSRDEDAAVFPVLEGLLGRYRRLVDGQSPSR